jgi:hypothetical protein
MCGLSTVARQSLVSGDKLPTMAFIGVHGYLMIALGPKSAIRRSSVNDRSWRKADQMNWPHTTFLSNESIQAFYFR